MDCPRTTCTTLSCQLPPLPGGGQPLSLLACPWMASSPLTCEPEVPRLLPSQPWGHGIPARNFCWKARKGRQKFPEEQEKSGNFRRLPGWFHPRASRPLAGSCPSLSTGISPPEPPGDPAASREHGVTLQQRAQLGEAAPGPGSASTALQVPAKGRLGWAEARRTLGA